MKFSSLGIRVTLNTTSINASDYKIGRVLIRRCGRLVKPYWTRPGSWRSWLAIMAMLVIMGLVSYLSIESADAMKLLTDALIAKDYANFQYWLMIYLATLFGTTMVPMAMEVIDSWLNVHWRTWMTEYFVGHYLAKRTYYDIASKGDLDNPDQRIQENVNPFIRVAALFPRMLLLQFVIIGTGVGILSSIDEKLTWVAFAFGLFQAIITYISYVPTIKQNYELQVAEADFRYGLLHVRENAEAIAFYQGEKEERATLFERLATAVRKQGRVLYYTQIVNGGLSAILAILWMLIPYLVLSPSVMSGELTFGAVTQGMQVSTQLLGAITALTMFLPMLSTAAPQAVRLAHIQERLEAISSGSAPVEGPQITLRPSANGVRVIDLSLQTPGGEQALVQHLSLAVREGESVAIIGTTGVGKSSLLRAMAGLWLRGEGALEMPAPRECLFLPQRPYMILSDLRSQLLYPHGNNLSDAELQGILEQVLLGNLLEKHGGLNAVRNWSKVLSLGEQQRIAFARILISKPRFVFFDEATSAVDNATEEHLYQLLDRQRIGYISIGHRLTIIKHHDKVLSLEPGGGWSLATQDEQP